MGRYTVVGVSTFLVDLGLLYALTSLGVPTYFAVVISFTTAVSINFLLSYRYVFTGTKRQPGSGYLLFLTIALIGFLVIAPGTVILNERFQIDLYTARVIMALLTGGTNFLLNNFLNFKMGLR